MKASNNLVWIDCEMTGLHVEYDVLLEIATIITDSQLNEVAQGPALVIHQPNHVLENMHPWCKAHHGASGLTRAVQESTVTLEQAQQQTLDFISRYCDLNTGVLAGNTVWQDRLFLTKYMPQVTDYLHYRLVDVSSIKELVKRWYPKDPRTDFKKPENHRALEDIRASIDELRHYRREFFV
ncbi:oligoribonuclease [Candidatus Dependentiae bacterium]|nr:oligoribonuclease [Candidatus Dependentiae bacterium]MCC7415409.1 oligoribonuclease [Campylobacterota bacterium]